MTYLSATRASGDEALLEELKAIRFRPSPQFLGRFDFAMFPLNAFRPGTRLAAEVQHLAAAVPGQAFNTVFVQKYTYRSGVRPHRDPKNNVGHTVIGLYGHFRGTRLRVGSDWFEQEPGQVWVLPCTIDGVQGPEHEIMWRTEGAGVRYALILNTIENGRGA